MSPDASKSKLERILAEVLEAGEQGRPVDRQRLLAQHPDLAGDLAAFFSNQDALERVQETLPPQAESRTLPPRAEGNTNRAGKPPKGSPAYGSVRYFGDYELLKEIARGGMGIVYKARQVNLNRVVALKMILSGQLASNDDVRRFYAEAEAAAQLDHPGIVPIHEVGQHEGQHFFSMAYVDGGSLAQRISSGPLPPLEAASLTRKVALAVAYAHSRGVIHRDLKPANVLLDRAGEPKITDFGLAKQIQGDSGLTNTGQILGTPSYMPPEQAAGRLMEVRETADNYAIGAVLYSLLTGRPPFQADNPLDTLLQVLERDPIPPRQFNANVPLDLETICLKCLEKDRRKRYATATEVADELGRLIRGEPVIARPVSSIERAWRWCKRHRALASSAALAALAIAATIVILAVSVVLITRSRNAAIQLAGENLQLAREKTELADAESKAKVAERTERVRAQMAEGREKSERQKAEQLAANNAKLAAEKGELAESEQRLRQQSERDVLELLFEQGYRRCLAGDPHAGLLWLERALRRARELGDAERESSIRWQIGAFRRALYLPWVYLPHNEKLDSAAFSSDGRMLLTCSFNQFSGSELRLWTVDNGQPVGEPFAVGEKATVYAFTANGQEVQYVGSDGALKTWNIASRRLTGKPLPLDGVAKAIAPLQERVFTLSEAGPRFLESSTGRLIAPSAKAEGVSPHYFAASPSGNLAATAASRGAGVAREAALQVWNTRTGRTVGPPLDAPHRLWSIAFSPDDKYLATAGDQSQTDGSDPILQIWDVATGRRLGVPLVAGGDASRPWTDPSLAFSPDSRLLAAATPDRGARVWRIADLRPVGPTLPHLDRVRQVAFSPDGKRLLTASDDRTVCLWDVETGERIAPPFQHAWFNEGLFSPDGSMLATVSLDVKEKLVRLWRTPPPLESGPRLVHVGKVTHVVVSPDGTTLATCSGEPSGWLRAFDLVSGKEIGAPRELFREATALAWHPTESVVVTAAGHATIRFWDTKTWQPISDQIRSGGVYGGKSFAFLPALDRFLLADGSDAALWEWSGRKLLDRPLFSIAKSLPPGRYQVSAVAVTPDGRFALSGGWNRVAQFWNTSTWTPVGEPMPHLHNIVAATIAANGQLAMTVDESQAAQLWEVPSGRSAGTLDHPSAVAAVAFHPQRPMAVTGGQDRTVRFWDLATRKQLGPPLVHSGAVNSLAFTPQGETLVVGVGDATVRAPGSVYRWKVPTPAEEPAVQMRPLLEWQTGHLLTDQNGLRPLTGPELAERRLMLTASPVR